MIVLGVDPGFSSLGWAAVEVVGRNALPKYCGVISTEKDLRKNTRNSEDNIKRAQGILAQLNSIAELYRPVLLCTETMSWPRNAGVVAKMGIAWGVIASFAYSRMIPVVQASPIDIKRKLTGNGKASKEDMILAVTSMFPELVLPSQEAKQEHAVDAVGAVIACMDTQEMLYAGRSNHLDP